MILPSMEHLSPNQRAWRRFLANRAAFGSAIFLAGMIALILVWPLVQPFSPLQISDLQSAPPSLRHPFGTDVHGRDLVSRVFYGARISLLVGAVGAGVSLVIGVLWGLVAGYLGGRIDSAMMRFVDILYSLPSIIFVIVLMSSLEELLKSAVARRFSIDLGETGRLLFLFVGLGSVSWLTMARIVRGQTLSLRNRSFIDASRVLGAGQTRIVLRHLLPNIVGVVIVYVMLIVPAIIIDESFLSYLGLGVQPPQASLGSLIAEGAAQINPLRIYWWMLLFPCGILTLTLLALNFAGDGLRDAFDTRLNE